VSAGQAFAPARCSINKRPRQTMSRGAPLLCFSAKETMCQRN